MIFEIGLTTLTTVSLNFGLIYPCFLVAGFFGGLVHCLYYLNMCIGNNGPTCMCSSIFSYTWCPLFLPFTAKHMVSKSCKRFIKRIFWVKLNWSYCSEVWHGLSPQVLREYGRSASCAFKSVCHFLANRSRRLWLSDELQGTHTRVGWIKEDSTCGNISAYKK